MARRLRDNRAAWIGVLGVTLAAIIAGLFGVWQSNRTKEKLQPQSSTEINVGTARDITVNNTNVTYNQRENESAGRNATQSRSEPIKLPKNEGTRSIKKGTMPPPVFLPDKTNYTPSVTPEPIEKNPATDNFLFYGLSASEQALLSSTLKRANAVSAVISVRDGARAGSQNASVKVAYADGSVYEDSFGVPTNNPSAAISSQLAKRFERRK